MPTIKIECNVLVDGGRYGVFCHSVQSLLDVGRTRHLAGLAASDYGAITVYMDDDRTVHGLLHRHLMDVYRCSSPTGEFSTGVWHDWLERAMVWIEDGGEPPTMFEEPA